MSISFNPGDALQINKGHLEIKPESKKSATINDLYNFVMKGNPDIKDLQKLIAYYEFKHQPSKDTSVKRTYVVQEESKILSRAKELFRKQIEKTTEPILKRVDREVKTDKFMNDFYERLKSVDLKTQDPDYNNAAIKQLLLTQLRNEHKTERKKLTRRDSIEKAINGIIRSA